MKSRNLYILAAFCAVMGTYILISGRDSFLSTNWIGFLAYGLALVFVYIGLLRRAD
jgi:hypothetical protein